MALAHITPLRDFFLFQKDVTNGVSSKDPNSTVELASRFRLLVRKLWNTCAFKAQVSPHELVQQVTKDSRKRFEMTKKGDPVGFVSWFLNALHGGVRGPAGSIVQDLFQGGVKIESQQIIGMTAHGAQFDPERGLRLSKYLTFISNHVPGASLFRAVSGSTPDTPLPG